MHHTTPKAITKRKLKSKILKRQNGYSAGKSQRSPEGRDVLRKFCGIKSLASGWVAPGHKSVPRSASGL